MSDVSLRDIISFNRNFKTAINLYLSLNKTEKILNYIPTKSSVLFMEEYIDAVLENKEQATLMIGPYGKGKSHLLLVLLGLLSLERNKANEKVIKNLEKRIRGIDEVGEKAADKFMRVWTAKRRFMPIILNDSKGDLNQAFLLALNDALKREGLENLAPDTYFSLAISRIQDWHKDYPDTFKEFSKELKKQGKSEEQLIAELKRFSKYSRYTLIDFYPRMT